MRSVLTQKHLTMGTTSYIDTHLLWEVVKMWHACLLHRLVSVLSDFDDLIDTCGSKQQIWFIHICLHATRQLPTSQTQALVRFILIKQHVCCFAALAWHVQNRNCTFLWQINAIIMKRKQRCNKAIWILP